jgi:hypothetical protein
MQVCNKITFKKEVNYMNSSSAKKFIMSTFNIEENAISILERDNEGSLKVEVNVNEEEPVRLLLKKDNNDEFKVFFSAKDGITQEIDSNDITVRRSGPWPCWLPGCASCK